MPLRGEGAGHSSDAALRLTGHRLQLIASPGGGSAIPLLHRPQRRAARVALAIGRCLPRRPHAGKAAWADAQAVIAAAEAPDGREAAVEFAAVRNLAKQRTVVLVLRERRPWLIGKCGPPDDTALVHEADVLQALQARGVEAPRLLAMQTTPDDRRILLQSALERSRRRVTLDEPAASELCLTLARAGVTHGDLAPWNVVPTASGPVLCDWEWAQLQWRPMWDLTHYYCRVGGLLGRWRPAYAVDQLVGPDGYGARFARTLGVRDAARRAATLAYLHHAAEERTAPVPLVRFHDEMLERVRGSDPDRG